MGQRNESGGGRLSAPKQPPVNCGRASQWGPSRDNLLVGMEQGWELSSGWENLREQTQGRGVHCCVSQGTPPPPGLRDSMERLCLLLLL